jgi:tryptophan synthase alpha chain
VSRIEKRFDQIGAENRKALVAFITAGDPDLAATRRHFEIIEQNGADIIELGVPFSDPLADGPVIQASSQRALKGGVTLKKIIALVAEIRKTSDLPIVLMSSFNPVFVYGLEAFVADAVAAGVDGVILPDLPPEEAGEFRALAEPAGLDTIFLLAPTSTQERVAMVAEQSRGFIYYVSLTGTTGMKGALSEALGGKVACIKQVARQPVLVGFGISGPEQACQAAALSDGVIIGSAIVRIIEQNADAAVREQHVGRFVADVKKALDVSR